jgi:hypothetical protein
MPAGNDVVDGDGCATAPVVDVLEMNLNVSISMAPAFSRSR